MGSLPLFFQGFSGDFCGSLATQSIASFTRLEPFKALPNLHYALQISSTLKYSSKKFPLLLSGFAGRQKLRSNCDALTIQLSHVEDRLQHNYVSSNKSEGLIHCDVVNDSSNGKCNEFLLPGINN